MNISKVILLSLLLVPGISTAQDYILWNGGIGLDEREQAPSNGTRLVFFADSGSFLAGIKVQIKNMTELVNTTTNGPWLILDLPAGQYQVRAVLNDDNAQGGLINVDGSSQEFAYMFPLEE